MVARGLETNTKGPHAHTSHPWHSVWVLFLRTRNHQHFLGFQMVREMRLHLQCSSVFLYTKLRGAELCKVALWVIRSPTASVPKSPVAQLSVCFPFLWCVQVYSGLTFSSALCTTLFFPSVITFFSFFFLRMCITWLMQRHQADFLSSSGIEIEFA